MRTVLTCLLAATLLSACSSATPDLKSPCVGASGSPCERRPVNISHLERDAAFRADASS